MRHTRTFLGWDEPVLHLAATRLLQTYAGATLDLSSVLLIVPTKEAGRRLRETLAGLAATRDLVVTPGIVAEPSFLLRPRDARQPSASPLAVLALWSHVLAEVDLGEYPALFPQPPPEPRAWSWCMRTAAKLVQLRRDLGQNGLGIADVAAHTALNLPEPERWQDLAHLEVRYLDALAARGLHDPERAHALAAADPQLPDTVQHVIVIGTLDPLPLALVALEHLAARLPVAVWVHAPATLADTFDEWGRPLLPYWTTAPLDLPDASICLAGAPADQAQVAVRQLAAQRAQHALGDLAVGTTSDDLTLAMEDALTRAGLPPHDPQGRSLAQHPTVQLLAAWAALLRADRYAEAAALLRHPDVLAALAPDHPADLLAALDTCQNAHLPADLADLAAWAAQDAANGARYAAAPLVAAVARLQHWRGRGRALSFAEATRTLLQEIYAGRVLDLAAPADQAFAEAAAGIVETLAELETPALAQLNLAPAELLELLLHQLRGRQWYPDRPAAAVDLAGWLELPWNDAPVLVVAGMNDGRAPATVVGDLFLPDGLRTALGLANNERRFARDACALAAMAASRRATGALTLICGKVSAAGDPLKPSRLLFLCPDEELAARVDKLFKELSPSHQELQRRPLWQLQPPAPAAHLPRKYLRVTAFKSYLACPFRFYLSAVLKMQTADDRKVELDAMDFGSLCHHALEQMALEQNGMRDCTDPDVLATFLQAQAAAWVRENFGAHPPLPVVLQLDTARQRLAAAARVQAAHRAAGWRIHGEPEAALGGPDGVLFHGLPLHARVDRMDRHETSGALLLLDYKTSDRAVTPADAHVHHLRSAPEAPTCAHFSHGGKAALWTDLQLPLYALLLRASGTTDAISLGYLNLPKATSESGIAVWDDFDDELAAAAERCAQEVITAIQAGIFWPPAVVDPERDDFADLLLSPPEAYINAARLQGGTAP